MKLKPSVDTIILIFRLLRPLVFYCCKKWWVLVGNYSKYGTGLNVLKLIPKRKRSVPSIGTDGILFCYLNCAQRRKFSLFLFIFINSFHFNSSCVGPFNLDPFEKIIMNSELLLCVQEVRTLSSVRLLAASVGSGSVASSIREVIQEHQRGQAFIQQTISEALASISETDKSRSNITAEVCCKLQCTLRVSFIEGIMNIESRYNCWPLGLISSAPFIVRS